MSLSKKRITFFINRLSGGGAERVTCNLANFFYEKGFCVDVIVMSETKNEYELDEGVNRVYLLKNGERSNKIANYFKRNKRLKKYVKSNKDVGCYVVMLPVTTFMLVRLKKYMVGKLVMAERNNPSSYGFLDRLLVNYSAKRCDGLVVQTKEIGEYYTNISNKVIIPNAINKDVNLPKRGIIRKTIVAVGRLNKQKNYPMLIKAFWLFSREHPGFELKIFGQGREKRSIVALIKSLGLKNSIHLMGFVKNIPEQMVNATCFVMTSDYEGMPNALIEAMCMGIPCIATDCDGGGAKALIRNGKNGVLIGKNDVSGLVESLDAIVLDPEKAEKMGKEAMEIAVRLSYEVVYKKWLNYIIMIMDENG